jgi:hypothetical protein
LSNLKKVFLIIITYFIKFVKLFAFFLEKMPIYRDLGPWGRGEVRGAGLGRGGARPRERKRGRRP